MPPSGSSPSAGAQVGAAHPGMSRWLLLADEARSALALPSGSPALLAGIHHRLSSAHRSLLGSWPGLPSRFRDSLEEEGALLLSSLAAGCRARWLVDPSDPTDRLVVVELLDVNAAVPLDDPESLLAAAHLAWGRGRSGRRWACLVPSSVLPELVSAAGRCPSRVLELPLHEDDLPAVLETALHLWDERSEVLHDLTSALAAARALLAPPPPTTL